MSNYSNFFPKSSSTLEVTPGNKKNRQIFYGPSTESWPVPEGTTEVEVHVWGGGGGGNGTPFTGGGGGGGYARTRYVVTSTDSLCITVGGASGTSSVTIPTQSPTSPVSATGGGNAPYSCSGCCWSGASGGSGSVSLGPSHPTSYCYTASGGRGGDGCCTFVSTCAPCSWCAVRTTAAGGGGSAGSPFGNGGAGSNAQCITTGIVAGGGGGIGGDAVCSNAGGTRSGATVCSGGLGNEINFKSRILTTFTSNPCITTSRFSCYNVANCSSDTWFSVEEIKGAGGLGYSFTNASPYGVSPISLVQKGGTGAGGGGGGILAISNRCFAAIVQGASGGLLGGGGGIAVQCCNTTVCGPTSSLDGKGGAAGGSGGSPGTPGVVIVYW